MNRSLLAGFAFVLFLVCVWIWVAPRQRASAPPKIASPVRSATVPRTTSSPVPVLLRPAPAPAATNAIIHADLAAPISSANQPAAFTAFSDWAELFLTGNPAANLAQGEALAWKRREAMLELIESNPARAIELAVPFRWRQSLPEKITRHFEQWVDGRGSYEVAMAQEAGNGKTLVYRWAVVDGKRYNAFVYGRRLAQPSRAHIPLHGIAIDNQLALFSDPVRILEPDETSAREQGRRVEHLCSVCAQPVNYPDSGFAADLGGEITYFCGRDHFSLVNERWQLAESGGGGGANLVAGGGDTWTQGRKTVLYMRVNFPDDLSEPISEAGAYSAMNEVNRFYVVGSYDTTWLTTTVTPLVTLPQSKGWYATAGPASLLADARAVARKAGFDTINYDLDIVSHTSVPGFDWGGLGYVGGKGVWLQSPGAGVTAHELGHNYGLPHANFWDTLTNSGYTVIGWGTNLETGNSFDTMGQAAAGNNQFSAFFKNALGWLPDSAVHDITSNGVYRIYPFDVPQRAAGRFYAAKVHKDFERDYWMEFRQAFPGNAALQNGILLDWSPWSQSKGGIEMLDTTAHTLDRGDSAVVVGRTFSDAPAGVHITPVARGATGADPWLDVQVNLGFFPGNSPPLLNVEVTPTNAAPGQLVRFHATATDPNGDTLAYAWTFDDATFSINNLAWAFKSWSQAGEHVVRCVVSDMKGGSASANVVVTVGSPAGFRVSGVVLDENDEPVEGVRVDNGILTATTNYVSSFTDSDGGFILTGLSSDLTLQATKFGYTFTNVGWDNPLVLTSSVANINFLATLFTNFSLKVSTNVVRENGSGGQFTITRSDPSTNDLTVSLMVSGTASVPADIFFNPPLSNGVNVIVIPGTTNQLTFTFTPVNDFIVEGTETVNLTLLDDTNFNYVVASAAEVRINILDDDQPVLPQVAVVAGNSSVTESSSDNGSFVFSRTGSTSNSLSVFYTVSGTATPGVDYPTLVGVVVIPAGRSSTTLEFHPLDDKDVEPDETVIVTLTANPAYTISLVTDTVTIVDDDLLVVSVTPTLANTAEPSTPGRFTIKRDGDQSANLVVYYTMSGTASNGVDYVSPSGAVTIPGGQTSADVVITPLDDLLIEGDESVVLTIINNPGYDIGIPGSATLLIRDDEKYSISVTAPDPTASEPGSDFGSFLISRGSVVNGDLTVNFIVNGTAIGGVDYVPLDNFVIIPNGSSSVTLDVIPFDDLHLEPDEDVIITLVASTNYNLGTARQARVTIADDDATSVPAVGFTFSSSSAPEDESPGVSVSLSQTSSVPISVSYRVIGGTASASDYLLGPGLLTFDPGERAKSIPLTINDDAIIEPNETIRLTIYDPTNATLDGIKIHTYTIIDNDSSSMSVSATANAFEAGAVPGNFRITRTGATNASQLVNFQLTGTASAPGDFALPGTSTTIPAGATFVDVPIVPTDDATVELDQTVVLTLISAPGGNIVAPRTATLTLFDNDPDSLPVVSISSINAPIAVEGGGAGAFVFTRSGSTTGSLTLNLTIGGTAGNGVDYTLLSNTVVFQPGQSSYTLPVAAIDDSAIEGDETVVATLTVLGTYRVAFPAAATVTIQDNDQTVRIDASDFTAAEPGTDLGAFTFTRFGSTIASVQVFFTISGTAINGVDYVTITNYFFIPAGSLSATLPIIPLDDSLIEGPETVTLTLQGNPAYVLASPTTATVTILDDEPMVSIIAPVPEVTEGSRQPGVFRVLRGGNPNYEFTARLAVSGTATFGVDYPPFLTNVLFNCGITAIDLLVFPTNELVVESTESVNVAIVPNPSYFILAPSNASVAIHDAGTNRAPVVTITSPTADTVYLLGTNVNLILEATVLDEGDTNTTVLTVNWTNISGPDSVVFNSTNPLNATVSFTNSGVYVLRLTADDGQLTNFADLTVMVDTLGLLSSNLLHWPLDDGSGTNVADISGNGHAGVVNGPANWTTNGIIGGALRLNGTNNLLREAVDSALLNGRKQFSLSLWVKADVTNSARGIFTAHDSGTDPTLTLTTRNSASCGSATNVIEATLASTRGATHLVSGNNRITSQWSHLALSWSNGLAPQLFINGIPDPAQGQASLRGVLTNCPQFIVGRGPIDVAGLWAGFVDDVRVFDHALSGVEIEGFTATNYGPIVEVATNLTVQILTPVPLSGIVIDDGRLNPPGVTSNTWIQISGPVPVSLSDPHNLTNIVSFTQSGDYVFRLIADDRQVKVFKDLTVTVVEPTQVSVFASDSDAAELGPDTGEFTFMRIGDLGFDMSIQVVLAGSASNALDYVFIPQTNTVVLPAGIDTVKLTITPFLDHRTEGDETVTYTIVSNLAYTIGNGQATVTIHDSPYGVWNIAHFTLEELTDPALSGEGVDFDHDRLVNFVEYALNRDPKVPETNAPMVMAIETNHVTITYQRRLEPTDVAYEVRVTGNLLGPWQTGTNYVRDILVTDDGNGLTETVKAQVVAPMSTAPAQFINLRVWLRATGP